MSRRLLAIVVVLMTLLASPRARADEKPGAADAAAAQRLFDEARTLMADKRWAEACPKLAASQRLDPGVGTLLNLAECYERTGMTASAWATYREAEAIAKHENQPPRARFAATHADALEPRLARVTLRVADATKVDGLVLRHDGVVLPEAAWGTSIPLDPGEHVVQATAPDRMPYSRKFALADGARLELTIPPLLAAPAAGPAPPTAKPESSSTARILGWSLIGVGALAAGGGTYFGLRAFSRYGEADRDHCSPVDCDRAGIDLVDHARSDALVSTLLFAGAVAAVGGGIILLVTSGRSSAARAGIATKMVRFEF